MATPFIDFRPAQVMRNKEVYVSITSSTPPATVSNACAYAATESRGAGSRPDMPPVSARK